MEDTDLKYSSVASDLQGDSAQAILRAIIAVEQGTHVLADLAKRHLRNNREQLERALVGHLSEHQRFLLKDLLVHLDFLDEQIIRLEGRIETKLKQMPPFQQAVALLGTIP